MSRNHDFAAALALAALSACDPAASPSPSDAAATDTADSAPGIDTADSSARASYPAGTLVRNNTFDFAFVVPTALTMRAPASADEVIYDALDARGARVGYVFLSLGQPPGVGGGEPQMNPFGVPYYPREVDRLSGFNFDVFFLTAGNRVAYGTFAQKTWRDEFVATARWLK